MTDIPAYVVLNGGGIQGLHFIGALAAMEDCGWTGALRGCAGSSVGSIIALALICGIDSTTLQKLAHKYLESTDVRFHIVHLFKKFGMNDGATIQTLIEDVLTTAGHPTNITFRVLFYATNQILHITGTDLTRRESVLFNHLETPDMPVMLAILISTRIPILFEPIRYEGRLYCDGCVTRDFPMGIFPPDKTIGFFLRTDVSKQQINSLRGYLASIFMTIKRHYFDTGLLLHPKRTITIPCRNNLNLQDMKCTEQDMKQMIATGYASVMRWWIAQETNNENNTLEMPIHQAKDNKILDE